MTVEMMWRGTFTGGSAGVCVSGPESRDERFLTKGASTMASIGCIKSTVFE